MQQLFYFNHLDLTIIKGRDHFKFYSFTVNEDLCFVLSKLQIYGKNEQINTCPP